MSYDNTIHGGLAIDGDFAVLGKLEALNSLNVSGECIMTDNVVCGDSTLATDATEGFLYIPSCEGTPTGVPVTKPGTVAMVYDKTNDILYCYNNSWNNMTSGSI